VTKMPDRVGQHQGVAVFAADRDGFFVQRPRSVALSQVALDLTEGFECPDQIAPLPGLPAQPHGLDQVAMRIGQAMLSSCELRGPHQLQGRMRHFAPSSKSAPPLLDKPDAVTIRVFDVHLSTSLNLSH